MPTAKVRLESRIPEYIDRLDQAKGNTLEEMGEFVRADASANTRRRTGSAALAWYWTTIRYSTYEGRMGAARAANPRGTVVPEVPPRSGYVRVSNAMAHTVYLNDGGQGRPGDHMLENATQRARGQFGNRAAWRIANALK